MSVSKGKEQINLRVEPDVAQRLRILSAATGLKINFVVERAVIEALEALETKHRSEIDRYQRGLDPVTERRLWLQEKIKIATDNIGGRTGKAVAGIVAARDELQRELDELTEASEDTLQAGATKRK